MPESMDSDQPSYEIYETFSETIVAFVGEFGCDGVMIFRPPAHWHFHPPGSIVWDSVHQEVYRNHRAESKTAEDLRKSGVPLPPQEALPSPLPKAKKWEDNFRREIPFDEIPERLRSVLIGSPDPKTLFLVLYEDRYETAFGDGKFLYPKAIFSTEAAAQEFISSQASPPPKDDKKEIELGYEYSLKRVILTADPGRKMLSGALGVGAYEHFSIDDILRLLVETAH